MNSSYALKPSSDQSINASNLNHKSDEITSSEIESIQSITNSNNQVQQDVVMTTMITDSNSEFTHQMKSKKIDIELNNKKSAQAIKFISGDKSVIYRAKNMNKVTGIISESTIIFPEAWKSTDMTYRLLKDQLKMELRLKDKNAPKSFEFELNMTNVTPRKNLDNSIDFLDNSGKIQFSIPKIWVIDSSSQELRFDPLTLSVSQQKDKTYIKISLNDTGLQYPLVIDPTTSLTSRAATIVSDTIPTIMKAGKTYPVSITVRNDGSELWSEASFYRLGAYGDNDPFANGRQYFDYTPFIAPGQSFTFNFQMRAPNTVGTYTTDWQMVQDTVTWFGGILSKQVSVVDTPPEYLATILSDTIPSNMETGKSYPVTVTVRNDGNNSWTEALWYRLGAVNDYDPLAPGRIFIANNQSIATGQTYSFQYTIVAPTTPGNYITNRRMVRDAVTWFGTTLTKTVSVIQTPPRAATIISDTIPTAMEVGKSYNVSITVRNDGANPWNEVNSYRLGDIGEKDVFVADGRQFILNNQTVSIEQYYTFYFTMTAPANQGMYTTDWQMLQEHVSWFGGSLVKYISVIDPKKSNKYLYDSSGRLQTTKLFTGHRVEYEYDPNGNTTRKTFSANLLDNFSFENGSTSWLLGPSMTVSSQQAKDSKTSLKFYQSSTSIPITVTRTEFIKVLPNTTYTLSGWALDSLTSGSMYVHWMEYNTSGTNVVDGLGYRVNKEQWKWNSVTFTTSPNTSYIIVRLIIDSTPSGEAYFDGLKMVQGVQNPNFNSGTEGWALGSNMSISNLRTIDGDKSLRFNSTTTISSTAESAYIAATPNSKYTLSASLYDNLSYGSFYIDWQEYDINGNILVDGPGALFSTKRGSGQWDSRALSFTTGPKTSKITVRIIAGDGAIGEGFIDGIMLKPEH